MATLLKIVAAGTVGVMLGLLVTIVSLSPATRGLVAGPWRGSPREGTTDVDPYTLASINRSGTLPLGAAEGLSFVATADSAGGPLSPECDYAVTGAMPAARFWTLGALTPDGFSIPNAAQRYAFTSAEVLRQNREPVLITVATEARSGNWLPIGKPMPYVLALRLYDTGLSAVGSTFDAATLPRIQKLRCH
ncbi:DUF1214 domain-containing protein [Beijerinckia sp. L45]|uniref:DUF1214 domain-containing protein n=1 Tax=Beijerinckia sp. L45 TaxID=1641855 RepID=UPI001FEDAEBC|nr:DUF1214 domain-containing protein [Beijerinckia sp. L45]